MLFVLTIAVFLHKTITVDFYDIRLYYEFKTSHGVEMTDVQRSIHSS